MAAPIIKMYATDKMPQFEAFVSTKKYPHANELWREEFDVGYTKGEGWSGGKKKPTPFFILLPFLIHNDLLSL